MPFDGGAHRRDGKLVSGESVRVHPDIDGAGEPADEIDFPHAGRAFELCLNDLVGNFRQLPLRTRPRHRDGKHGLLIGVGLGNGGRVHVARQLAEHGGDAIAHVLRGDVTVAVQIEGDHDEGGTRAVDGAQFVNAFNGVNHLLNGLCHLRLHLGRRRAGQAGADAHNRHINRREAVHAEVQVARRAHDDECQDDHHRQHRPANADFSELLHRGSAVGRCGCQRGQARRLRPQSGRKRFPPNPRPGGRASRFFPWLCHPGKRPLC